MTQTLLTSRTFNLDESKAIHMVEINDLMVNVSWNGNPDKVYTYQSNQDFVDILSETISGTVDGGLNAMIQNAIRAGDLTLI